MASTFELTDDIPFDLRPMESLSIDALDLDYFQRTYLPASVSREVLAENQRSLEQQLASLRFATTDDPPHPTVLGLLVCGKPFELGGVLPDAYVQFVRFDGTELTDPIRSQREIHGPLPELLRHLDELLESNLSIASDIASGPLERRSADYPLSALQQLTRNAVLHRSYESMHSPVRVYWYSDRIEIHSPGGPFGSVTRKNFGEGGATSYRNPHLAEALKNLGYVQRFGMGIPLARKHMHENGNPEPEFTVEDTSVLVTLRGRK